MFVMTFGIGDIHKFLIIVSKSLFWITITREPPKKMILQVLTMAVLASCSEWTNVCIRHPVIRMPRPTGWLKISWNICPFRSPSQHTILRSHPRTPGRWAPGPFTNSFWRDFFLCGVWGSLGHLPRVCGQNHWTINFPYAPCIEHLPAFGVILWYM